MGGGALLAPTIVDLPPGIEAVALPVPFPVDPVNCYLLVDEPVTLVDPGMVWGDTEARLAGLLGRAGLGWGDVAQVVVTHGHPDHFGAAGLVASRSGATVVCGRADEAKVRLRFEPEFLMRMAEDLGAPAELRSMLAPFIDGVRAMVAPLPDGCLQVLDDGAALDAGGREWTVHVTPGHSAGHVSLWDGPGRTLLSGDHLLAAISPNPMLEPDATAADGRRPSLSEYLASLARFAALDPARVLPGHGPRFTGVPGLAAALAAHHQARAVTILEAIRRVGVASPYELARTLFPAAKGFELVLALSEVVGHLDLLEGDGRVTRRPGPPQRYAAA